MTQDADTTRIQRLRTDRGEREEVAGESSADLPRIYREVPVGLCYLDTDLRFVHVNEWLAALSGLSVEEHLGRAIGEVLPDVAAAVESQLRGVAPAARAPTRGSRETRRNASSASARPGPGT